MNFLNYIIRGITYFAESLLPATIAYLFIICLACILKPDSLKIKKSQYISGYIFAVYLTSVGRITGVLDTSLWHWNTGFGFNLIPFINEGIQPLLLNVLMFFPMGILIPLTFSGSNWSLKKIFVAILSTSLFIEIVQLLCIGRICDIDDILANTLGGIIGYLTYQTGKKIGTKYTKINLGLGWVPVLLNFAAIIWIIPYKRICLGDIVLMHYHLPTWSDNAAQRFSLSGFHYSLVYALVFIIPAFILAFRNEDRTGRRIGMGLSIITIVVLTILAVTQY